MIRIAAAPTGRIVSGVSRLTALAVLSLALGTSVGCFTPPKGQTAEDAEREKILDIDTIGDVTLVSNVDPQQVQGVGLVTGLQGTGGGAPAGELRTLLENELKRLKIPSPKQVLDSPETAMVIVTGFIPAGARKGEQFDVYISLPPGSKVSSLRGGYLQECYLRPYENTRAINPNSKKPNQLVAGHQLAKAKGPLIVGLDQEGNADPNLLTGIIWDGGVSFIDRPYFFELVNQRQLARVANSVAQRINAMFPDDPQKRLEAIHMKGLLVLDEMTSQLNAKFNQSVLTTRDTAKAMNEKVVAVNVPWEYRNNPQRYILVARQIPLAEPKEKRHEYRQKLRDMLQDPAHTVRAAVRLEALGKESVPALKSALEHPHPLVRFAAAESLAYLGDGSGVSELAQLAEQHYQLRAHCLTALASLDLTASRTKLTELLASGNTETRYGAFRGLQLLNVAHPSVTGELLGGSVRLHRLAPHSPGLVHFTLHRRAEVTLFGQDAYLVPPFKIPAGQEFTITAAAGDKLCTIGHYQVQEGRVSHRQCSLKLEEVLRTLTDMGGEYPEVVDLLRQAGDLKRIDCAVCLNAVPQPTSVEELAKAGLDPKQWNIVPARLDHVNPSGLYDPHIRQASGVSDQ